MGIEEPKAGEQLVYLSDLPGHSRAVYALGWNSTGSMLASGSTDRSIRLWDPETSKNTAEMRGHTDQIYQLRWDPTNLNRLATTAADKTIRIWDAKASKITHTVSTTTGNLCIAYSQDGKFIAFTTSEGISLVDTRKYRVIKRIANPSLVNEMKFNKDGYLFTAAGHPQGYGTFEILKIENDKKGSLSFQNIRNVQAHTGVCNCLDFDPTHRFLAVGSDDSLVSIWNLEELYCTRTLTRSTNSIRTLAYSPDGRFLASGSEAGIDGSFIDIADIKTGEQLFSVALKRTCEYLCWHPQNNILAYVGDVSDKYGDRDGIIRMVQVKPSS